MGLLFFAGIFGHDEKCSKIISGPVWKPRKEHQDSQKYNPGPNCQALPV